MPAKYFHLERGPRCEALELPPFDRTLGYGD
jgi:hypothetical protein